MPYRRRLAPASTCAYADLPTVIAHRGASGHAPENTMAAFQHAIEQGARWIEVDVALTADGIPVIFHDETLERCSNGHGYLIQHTAGQLQQLDCGHWFSEEFKGENLVLLEQLLRFAMHHQIGLNLEIKPIFGREQNTVWAVANLIQKLPINTPILFSSFNPLALEFCHQLMPEYSRAWLTEALPDNWQSLLERFHCSGIHYQAEFHHNRLVCDIRNAGYRVLAYTVNDPEQASWLLSTGVNGVFSDYPGELIQRTSAPELTVSDSLLTH